MPTEDAIRPVAAVAPTTSARVDAPGINIRPIERSDFDAAYDLMVALGYPSLGRDDFARAFAAVLEHSEMLVLVAEAPDRGVVGLASISHRPQLRLGGRIATIDEFVVADGARGGGVGRALLARAKTEAARLGARRLELTTNRGRESYRRGFYRQNGLVEADSAVMRLDAAALQRVEDRSVFEGT